MLALGTVAGVRFNRTDTDAARPAHARAIWMTEETMKLVMFAGTVGFVAVVSLSLLAVADILLTPSDKPPESERLA